jgi:hypothetical protein
MGMNFNARLQLAEHHGKREFGRSRHLSQNIEVDLPDYACKDINMTLNYSK